MSQDLIVAEIRRIREELAAKHNYDILAIGCAARERERASGRKTVTLPPRRPPNWKPAAVSAPTEPNSAPFTTDHNLGSTSS